MTPADVAAASGRPPRVLITNAVPLNGGDEALLRATIGLLTDEFPGCSTLHLVEHTRLELIKPRRPQHGHEA